VTRAETSGSDGQTYWKRVRLGVAVASLTEPGPNPSAKILSQRRTACSRRGIQLKLLVPSPETRLGRFPPMM